MTDDFFFFFWGGAWWEKEKMLLPAFSPFPTMFSKGFYFEVVERRNSVAKTIIIIIIIMILILLSSSCFKKLNVLIWKKKTLNGPEMDSSWEHCGKMQLLETSILPVPTMISTLPNRNFNFSVAFILSLACAFNLVQSRILSIRKCLMFGC